MMNRGLFDEEPERGSLLRGEVLEGEIELLVALRPETYQWKLYLERLDTVGQRWEETLDRGTGYPAPPSFAFGLLWRRGPDRWEAVRNRARVRIAWQTVRTLPEVREALEGRLLELDA